MTNPLKISLKRSLSCFLLMSYGLGTILGAGIYVLVGKVAGISGVFAPFSFLVAALIAFFSAVSYAEFASRYPYSAGEAYYVNQGFRRRSLAGIVGWLVVLTGVVSAATLSKGFVGYFQVFFSVPAWTIITILVVSLGALAIWGIVESVIVTMVITWISVIGLLFVLVVAGHHLTEFTDKFITSVSRFELNDAKAIILGAFVAFYAFIGFEDMVNVAEEVINPRRTIPQAIFIALAIAAVLYFFTVLVAILALPISNLAASKAPLALIVQQQRISPKLIGLISLIAIVNGILVQIIMASRVIYGMAKQQNAPNLFARVNARTQTPILATISVIVIILLLALSFPVLELAKATSFIILLVFLCVNLSLIVVKLSPQNLTSDGIKTYSIGFPIVGVALIVLFISVQLFSSW